MFNPNLLTFRKIGPVHLKCTIDLSGLYSNSMAGLYAKFRKNLCKFIASAPANREIYQYNDDHLIYKSEQLIPSKIDDKKPLLLVFGNPASHSVKEGMFFSYEGKDKGKRKEHRFWKSILGPLGIFDIDRNTHLTIEEINEKRRESLLNVDYKTDFRIGLTVFVSQPSESTGDWSGVNGVKKLLRPKAMKVLEPHERKRIIDSAREFLGRDGIVVTFQKNAWEGLKSENDPKYSLDAAKKGNLRGWLRGLPNIPLYGVPPTRLAGPCRETLKKLLL